jgi:hypothetical protein
VVIGRANRIHVHVPNQTEIHSERALRDESGLTNCF